MDSPTISATAKGPNQINLTWGAIANPGWGYLVEIQSDADSRYASYTQLTATKNGRAWLPYWVTEAHHTDITDGTGTSMGTAAQFQMYGLKYGTLYNFRVRCYAKTDAGVEVFGAYSTVASATTTTPATIRYVVVGGAGTQSGTSFANAWPKISSANGVASGTLVLVRTGNYPSDNFTPSNSGTQATRIVLQAEPVAGTTVTVTSTGAASIIYITGNYVICDGINIACSSTDPRINIWGDRNAIVNASIDAVSTGWGACIYFDGTAGRTPTYNLVHYCYCTRAGTNTVDDGDTIVMLGAGADRNVVQYSNSNRGGHDTGLLQDGADYSQWKNNLFDGGWAMGWECVSNGGAAICTFNLFEGNVVKDVATSYPAAAYKPCIEVSGNSNTIRRNIIYNGGVVVATDTHGMEISAFNAGQTSNNNLVYNNVCYNNKGHGIVCFDGGGHNVNNNTIRNNILAGNQSLSNDPGTDLQMVYYDSNSLTGNVADYNCLLRIDAGVEFPNSNSCARLAVLRTTALANGWTEYGGPSGHNVTTSPAMIDVSTGEFHLKSTSGLRGIGLAVTDTTWGTTGETDLGAFKWFDPTSAGPAAPTDLRVV